ncbi:MAG: hypothetical protein H7320_16035, partial [Ferruginibacter sp.]|nr:hypothetical protein [Ferruginibacter sp.]
RIPYLNVLAHLNIADGIFILGSTEPHYTPSKVYQGVLSGKPLLAELHSASTAREVLEKAGAGIVLAFDGEKGLAKITTSFDKIFEEYRIYMQGYSADIIDMKIFDQYSAYNLTGILADLLNQVFNNTVAGQRYEQRL